MCSPKLCYLFFFLGYDGLCYFGNNDAPYSFPGKVLKTMRGFDHALPAGGTNLHVLCADFI